MFASSIFTTVLKAMICPFVWTAAVLRHLSEGKALLAGVQAFVVAAGIRNLEQRRVCANCGGSYTNKDSGSTVVSTVFGRIAVGNPRWNRCPCQTDGRKTFRPMRTWLTGQTSPEMLYLETKREDILRMASCSFMVVE